MTKSKKVSMNTKYEKPNVIAEIGCNHKGDMEIAKQHQKRSNTRKTMVSTGDRSAKIRTYNFPQGRITDHRINLTLYKLQDILNGNLNEMLDALKLEEQKSQLQEI